MKLMELHLKSKRTPLMPPKDRCKSLRKLELEFFQWKVLDLMEVLDLIEVFKVLELLEMLDVLEVLDLLFRNLRCLTCLSCLRRFNLLEMLKLLDLPIFLLFGARDDLLITLGCVPTLGKGATSSNSNPTTNGRLVDLCTHSHKARGHMAVT